MKRYIDTDLWQKQWYMDLSLKLKLLVRYMYDNCDCVGVFTPNWRLISFLIGVDVTEDDICELNNHKVLVEKLENGKFFIAGFVDFQYGELTTSCKPHIRYMEELKKHGLYERVCKGYAKGINTLEEQEKDKEEEKEEERGLLGGKAADLPLNVPTSAEECMAAWNSLCEQTGKLAKIKTISDGRKRKLKTRFKEKNFNFEAILKAIPSQPFLLGSEGWTVTFDWLIESEEHYLKVLEGNYKNFNQKKGGGRYGSGTGNASEYGDVVEK